MEYYISILVFAFGIITWIPFLNGVYGHDQAAAMYSVERSMKDNVIIYKDSPNSAIGSFIHIFLLKYLLGNHSTKAFYWTMCLYCSFSTFALFWVIIHLFGLLPAIFGSILFSLYIASPRLDGNWGHHEQLIPLPLFGSILLMLISPGSHSYLLIMLSGMLSGYAILNKQTAVLYIPGYFIMLAGTGHSFYHHLTFLCGIIITNLIPLLYYWLRHNAFWEYLIATWLLLLPCAINPKKYNKSYPGMIVKSAKTDWEAAKHTLIENSRSLLPVFFLSIVGVTILFGYHFSLFYLGLFVCLIPSVSMVFMKKTFFPHYWLNMVPWLVIFAGFGLSEIIKSSFRVGHPTVFTLIGIPIVILLFIDAIRVDKKYYVFSRDPYQFLKKVHGQPLSNGYKLMKQIGEFIKETTKPSDKIMVCGFTPHIALYSERVHFTREVCHYANNYIETYSRDNPSFFRFLNSIYGFKVDKQNKNVFHNGYPEVIVFGEGKAEIDGFEKLTGIKYSLEENMGGLIPVFRADLELTELMSLYENPDNTKSSIESDADLESDELTDNTGPTEPVRAGTSDWNIELKKAKRLLKKDPNNIKILLSLGDCLIGAGKYNLLLYFYKRLIENNFVSTASICELLNKLGEAYCSQNKFIEAEETFLNILKINPDHPTVLNNLGFTYSQQNNNQKASECFHKALVLDPDNEDALANLEQIKTLAIQ